MKGFSLVYSDRRWSWYPYPRHVDEGEGQRRGAGANYAEITRATDLSVEP